MPALTPDQLALLLREAKLRGLITVLDVVMPAGVIFGLEQVAGPLSWTDYFLPNEDEAQRLTGMAGARTQAESLNALNEDCVVVITRGRHGSVAKHRERFIDTEPFRMETVDESGAGDAFTAGLITGLLEGWALDYTLSFAAAVGASCTRALGCSSGVFTFDQAVAFLEQRTAQASGMEQ
jgi:sugar/nucleoside kinase (ribokinase family)